MKWQVMRLILTDENDMKMWTTLRKSRLYSNLMVFERQNQADD